MQLIVLLAIFVSLFASKTFSKVQKEKTAFFHLKKNSLNNFKAREIDNEVDNSSICLGFSNLRERLRCWDLTSFCRLVKNDKRFNSKSEGETITLVYRRGNREGLSPSLSS